MFAEFSVLDCAQFVYLFCNASCMTCRFPQELGDFHGMTAWKGIKQRRADPERSSGRLFFAVCLLFVTIIFCRRHLRGLLENRRDLPGLLQNFHQILLVVRNFHAWATFQFVTGRRKVRQVRKK